MDRKSIVLPLYRTRARPAAAIPARAFTPFETAVFEVLVLKWPRVMYHHNNRKGGLTERRRYHWQYRSNLRNHRLQLLLTRTQSLQGFGRPVKRRRREQDQRTCMVALEKDNEHTNTAQVSRIASWAAARSAGGHSSVRHFMTPVTQTLLLHQQALSLFEQPVWSPLTVQSRVQPNQKLGEVAAMCQKTRERTGWNLLAEGNGCRDVRDERDKGEDGFHEGQLLERSTFFVFPLKALTK